MRKEKGGLGGLCWPRMVDSLFFLFYKKWIRANHVLATGAPCGLVVFVLSVVPRRFFLVSAVMLLKFLTAIIMLGGVLGGSTSSKSARSRPKNPHLYTNHVKDQYTIVNDQINKRIGSLRFKYESNENLVMPIIQNWPSVTEWILFDYIPWLFRMGLRNDFVEEALLGMAEENLISIVDACLDFLLDTCESNSITSIKRRKNDIYLWLAAGPIVTPDRSITPGKDEDIKVCVILNEDMDSFGMRFDMVAMVLDASYNAKPRDMVNDLLEFNATKMEMDWFRIGIDYANLRGKNVYVRLAADTNWFHIEEFIVDTLRGFCIDAYAVNPTLVPAIRKNIDRHVGRLVHLVYDYFNQLCETMTDQEYDDRLHKDLILWISQSYPDRRLAEMREDRSVCPILDSEWKEIWERPDVMSIMSYSKEGDYFATVTPMDGLSYMDEHDVGARLYLDWRRIAEAHMYGKETFHARYNYDSAKFKWVSEIDFILEHIVLIIRGLVPPNANLIPTMRRITDDDVRQYMDIFHAFFVERSGTCRGMTAHYYATYHIGMPGTGYAKHCAKEINYYITMETPDSRAGPLDALKERRAICGITRQDMLELESTHSYRIQLEHVIAMTHDYGTLKVEVDRSSFDYSAAKAFVDRYVEAKKQFRQGVKISARFSGEFASDNGGPSR